MLRQGGAQPRGCALLQLRKGLLGNPAFGANEPHEGRVVCPFQVPHRIIVLHFTHKLPSLMDSGFNLYIMSQR